MLLNKIKKFTLNRLNDNYEKEIVIKGKILAEKNSFKKKISDLSKVEFSVFSQWGEDGILDWIIRQIKDIPKVFLEIGTEDYKESNTRFLLMDKNWDAHLIDSDQKAIDNIKKQRIFWRYNINVNKLEIDKNNINLISSKFKIPKKLGLLSLDIDGIDYWVLKNLKNFSPEIIVCEYNSLFGEKKELTVPYKKNFNRTKEHYSNLYFGASINAFINLLKKKNYTFIGTNSSGNNAFFIKNKYRYIIKKIDKKKIFSSKFRESRNKKNNLNFLDKKKSIKIIKNKYLINIKTNRRIIIGSL